MSTSAVKSRARKAPGTTVARHGGGPAPTKTTGSGIVRYYVHDAPRTERVHADFNVAKLIKVVEDGLPVTELTDLQASLAVPAEKLAPMLGISKATFHRRKGTGEKLKPSVSDRVVRFAKLLGKAIKVLGDLDDAKRWLNSPQFGLGGAVPLDYAKTEVGAREVENLLGRIEYGVYS